MEVVIAAVISVTIGIVIGMLVTMIRLHMHSGGSLIFDKSDEKAAPYLAFESYDDLIEIRKKKYVTLAIGWAKSNSHE